MNWDIIIVVHTDSPVVQIGDNRPGEGYGDAALLFDKGGSLRYSSPARAWPNPFRPSDQAPWNAAYGCVAPGAYFFSYYISPKQGPCLQVANGRAIPARYSNPNQDGRSVISEVEVHAGGLGQNPNWPGSAGCITIPKGFWPKFIANFSQGDSGLLYIQDIHI